MGGKGQEHPQASNNEMMVSRFPPIFVLNDEGARAEPSAHATAHSAASLDSHSEVGVGELEQSRLMRGYDLAFHRQTGKKLRYQSVLDDLREDEITVVEGAAGVGVLVGFVGSGHGIEKDDGEAETDGGGAEGVSVCRVSKMVAE